MITTDDNLAPSRAYPLIQPIVHETPIAYPFNPYAGFSPFRVYDYGAAQAQGGQSLQQQHQYVQSLQSRNGNKDIQAEVICFILYIVIHQNIIFALIC